MANPTITAHAAQYLQNLSAANMMLAKMNKIDPRCQRMRAK